MRRSAVSFKRFDLEMQNKQQFLAKPNLWNRRTKDYKEDKEDKEYAS